jgi:hypothetical protein
VFFFFGTRRAGVIAAHGGTRIETHFLHVSWLPIVPVGSYLVLGAGVAGERAIPIGLHVGSTLAGYARTWGPVLIAAGWLVRMREVGTPWWLTMLAGAVATGLGFLHGRVGPDERARRAVYARYALHPVDPAHLGPARDQMAADLRQEIIARSRGTITKGYRDPAGGIALEEESAEKLVTRIAEDPTVEDEELLGAAMTLARIVGADRAHRTLWQRTGARR